MMETGEQKGAKAAMMDTTHAHRLTGSQWRRCKINSSKEWRVMTINIGGGRRALEWALEQDVHIILIQEHRGTKEKVAAYQMLAARYKWNGVWTEALETSYLGRSGGVAILAKDPILAVKGKGKYDHRWANVVDSKDINYSEALVKKNPNLGNERRTRI